MLDHILTKHVIMLAGFADHLELRELHLAAMDKTLNAIKSGMSFYNCYIFFMVRLLKRIHIKSVHLSML